MGELYRKKSNKHSYYKVGDDFKGFPVDGLWFVWNGRQNCIVQIDGLEGKSLNKMPEMGRTHTIIEEYLANNRDKSVAEQANEITTKLYVRE